MLGYNRKVSRELTQFGSVSPERSRNMAAIRGRGNKTTERLFRLALVRHGIRGWTLHTHDLIGRPDVFFPELNVAVFLDGCFWHGCPRCGHCPKTNTVYWEAKLMRNRARDRKVNRILRREGVVVVRFWEHELRDLTRCLTKLKKQIERSRS
jgi:DNA mismatch endonuclease (patch repair protein)